MYVHYVYKLQHLVTYIKNYYSNGHFEIQHGGHKSHKYWQQVVLCSLVQGLFFLKVAKCNQEYIRTIISILNCFFKLQYFMQ